MSQLPGLSASAALRRFLLRRRSLLSLGASAILAAYAWQMFPITQRAQEPARGEFVLAEYFLHGIPNSAIAMNMPMQNVFTGIFFDHVPPASRRWLPIILWTATLILVFTLGCRLHSPLCGGIATLFAAPTISYGMDFMTFYAFLVLLTANALAWMAQAVNLWRCIVVALAIGLTLLQRSPLFLFGSVLAAYLWVTHRQQGRRLRLCELAVLCIVPYLLLLPWIRMNWILFHRFLPFENGRADCNIVSGALGLVSTLEGGEWRNLVKLGPGDPSPIWFAVGLILSHPWSYLNTYAQRFWYVVNLYPTLFLLALLSVGLSRKYRDFQLLACLVVYYIAIHCLMSVKATYFSPVWPVLAVLAAGVIARLTPPDPIGTRICTRAVAFVGVLCASLGAFTIAVVAAYPALAANAECWHDALSKHPQCAGLHSEQGRQFLRQGELASAIEQLRLAQRLDPRPDRELDLAWAYLAATESHQVIFDHIDPLASTGLDTVRAHLLRMWVALQRNQGQQARAHFTAAVQAWEKGYSLALHPQALADRDARSMLISTDPMLAKLMGELLGPLSTERQGLLLKRFQTQVARKCPAASRVTGLRDDTEWWLNLAEEILPELDHTGRGREALAQALATPMNDSALERFSELCLRLRDADAARRLLISCTKKHGRNEHVQLALATLAMRSWERSPATAAGLSETLKQFAGLQAIPQAPHCPQCSKSILELEDRLCGMVNRFSDARDLGGARRILTQTMSQRIQLHPGALSRLAYWAAEIGANAEADYFLNCAIASHPPEDQIMSTALLYQKLGRHEKALALWDGLVKSHPRSGVYLGNRGVTKALLGRHDEAIGDLREAIRMSPRSLQSYLSLGALLSSRGQKEQALACYNQALSVASPGDPDIAPQIRKSRKELLDSSPSRQ